jgi:hypothetical protein
LSVIALPLLERGGDDTLWHKGRPYRNRSNGYLPIHEELLGIHNLNGLQLQTGAKRSVDA